MRTTGRSPRKRGLRASHTNLQPRADLEISDFHWKEWITKKTAIDKSIHLSKEVNRLKKASS